MASLAPTALGIKSVLRSGLSAMAPLPTFTSVMSSGGTSSLLLKCHTSSDLPAFASTGPPTQILPISKIKFTWEERQATLA